MYEAKHEGGDRARYFHPAMNEAIDEQLALELDLRRALQEGRLQLHYQPQVALRDGRLIGVEALMRWPDPQRGLVPPDRFIPLAEQCGLINELDAWALSTACAQMAAWRAQGLAVPNVAVNASARRFTQDDIAAEVATLLQRHRIDAASLTIEITERLLLDDNPRARAQLEQLHRMGVRLSVDDFGTGYSSLSYLKRLPLSEIKLDRSFVRDLETDPDDRALAGAVIGIGRALGLAVVAEGVETEAQRALLEQAQCHAVQGWLFARPMPAGQLASWLQQRPATAAAPAPTLQA
jgi:EAL domain-containing protein (putative c-di-GMP-specific phosphodiesterase class I)